MSYFIESLPILGNGIFMEERMDKQKYEYEIREIDAWADGEDGWTWNTSYKVGTISTAGDPGRAMMRMLNKKGVVCKRGACYISYDGDIYELRRRGTHEPYYAAIPMF